MFVVNGPPKTYITVNWGIVQRMLPDEDESIVERRFEAPPTTTLAPGVGVLLHSVTVIVLPETLSTKATWSRPAVFHTASVPTCGVLLVENPAATASATQLEAFPLKIPALAS